MPGWLSIGVGRASAGLISIRLPNSTELRYRDVTLSGSVTHSPPSYRYDTRKRMASFAAASSRSLNALSGNRQTAMYR